MTNEEFDHIVYQKLHEYNAPVSEALWNNITTSLPSNNNEVLFDAFVKEKLVNFIAPIPAGLWEKVRPNEDEKRRTFFFWLPRTSMIAASILLLVLAGSVSAYLYYQKIHETERSEISTKNTPEKLTNGANLTTILVNTPRTSGSTKSMSASTISEKSTTKPIPQINNKLPILTGEKIEYNHIKASLPFKGGLPPHSTTNLQNILTGINENESSNEASYISTKKLSSAFLFQQRNLFNAFKQKTIPNFSQLGKLKNIIICPSDKKSSNTDWDIELYISPDYAAKYVTSNTATTQFLNKKDSSETIGISYSAGFRIVKPFNDRLSIKSGLNFSQINEKFSYRSENEIKTTTVVTQRVIIRSPGDTVIISDTSTLQQIGFKNNNIKNNYRSIDIPLLIGYQFGNDDFSIGINTGVILNLTSWYKGAMFDSSFMPQTISKSGNTVYKQNIGLGIYAGLSFMKRLNYNTHIFAEPYIRYNLSNMTLPASSFKQRFSIGGLSVGLRFNLTQH